MGRRRFWRSGAGSGGEGSTQSSSLHNILSKIHSPILKRTANDGAEPSDVGPRDMAVVRPRSPTPNIGPKSEAASDIARKSSAPAVGTQQPRRSPQIVVKSRLAEEAARKLRQEIPGWEGIDYILSCSEEVGSGPSKTRGTFTVKELLDGMTELQKRRQETKGDAEGNLWKRLKMGERIDKSVGVLTHFLAAGDVAVSFDPVHAALPWAGIRVILVLLTSHAKVHDIVIACFHEVALLVLQCESYEQLYLDEALPSDAARELESAVIAAYCESLLFLTSARRYAEQGTASRFATTVFKLDKMKGHLSNLSDCISRLSHCSHVCQAEYSTQALSRLQQSLLDATGKLEDVDKHFGNISELLVKIHDQAKERLDVTREQGDVLREQRDILREQAQRQLSEKEEKCLRSFRLTTVKEDITYEWYKNRVEDRLEGTCQWFLNHPAFTTWFGLESGMLLVTADPGCGKSVLAKHLLDHVLPQSAAICYFFFKDNDQNTVRQALCAILHQLFSQRPLLIRHAIPEYEKNGDRLQSITASLWNILQAIGSDAEAGRVIILLDALDECALPDFKDLVQGLSTRIRGKVKVLATSRPYEHILAKFRNVVRIPGEREDKVISQEVSHVIKHRVGRLAEEKELDQDIRDHLEQHLLRIEHRTYLWVYLVFDHLAETNFEKTKKEIINTISTLPESINQAYERILSKPKDSKKNEKLRKALKLILAATRPLTLTEMSIAIRVDLGSGPEDLELPPLYAFETYLRNLCGLFISIYNGGVYFLHQTAREFLLADRPSTVPQPTAWQHSITSLDAHTLFAEVCLGYLNLFHPDTVPDDAEKRGFINYAAKNWAMHFREAQTDSNAAASAAVTVCENEKCIATWFPIFWGTTIRGKTEFSPLGIAAYLGLDSVVARLLETGAHLEMGDTYYCRSPLSWAALEGHEAIVKLLLQKNADIEAKDMSGRTPLSRAAGGGHEAIVKLLLQKNADIEATDKDSRTPLSRAAGGGHEAVVKLLLQKNANVEAKDIDGRTPLSWAALRGHEAVVKLLLQRNANIEAKDIDGRTPLSWAAASGHEAVVKVLLQRNADMEAKDIWGRTPLSWASLGGHEAVMKLFVHMQNSKSVRLG